MRIRVFCSVCRDYTGTIDVDRVLRRGTTPQIRIPYECHGDVDYAVVTREFLVLFNESAERDPNSARITTFIQENR